MVYDEGKLSVTGVNATAHIFATYPAPYLSITNGFADQVKKQHKSFCFAWLAFLQLGFTEETRYLP